MNEYAANNPGFRNAGRPKKDPAPQVRPRSWGARLRTAAVALDYTEISACIEALSNQDDNGCWIWSKTIKRGYPVVGIDGRTTYVHRLSLEAKMRAPLGKQPAHHMCATSACVNPSHLQPVTHAQNVAEMLARNYLVARIDELEAELARLDVNNMLLNRVGVLHITT